MIFLSRFLAQARNVNCFASGTIRILTASQDSNWFIEKEAGKSSQAGLPPPDVWAIELQPNHLPARCSQLGVCHPWLIDTTCQNLDFPFPAVNKKFQGNPEPMMSKLKAPPIVIQHWIMVPKYRWPPRWPVHGAEPYAVQPTGIITKSGAGGILTEKADLFSADAWKHNIGRYFSVIKYESHISIFQIQIFHHVLGLQNVLYFHQSFIFRSLHDLISSGR